MVFSFAAQVKITIADQITAIFWLGFRFRLDFRLRLDFLYEDAPPEISDRWAAMCAMLEHGRDIASGRAVRSILAMTLARWQDSERLKAAGPSSLANPWIELSPGLKALGERRYARRFVVDHCSLQTNRNCQPMTDALLGAQSGARALARRRAERLQPLP